jgi:chaperonin cofactor prefoldin
LIVHPENLTHQERDLKKFGLELKLEKLEEELDEMEDRFPTIGNFERELEKKAEKLKSKLKFGKIKSHADN